jgi:Domain of Unknown Function (DUF1080)
MRSLFATALLTCLTLAGQTTERGFVPLFDGKTLKGWTLVDGKGPGYVVENGILICPADGGGNLFTEKEYANFILRFEFLLTPGGNNGMGIRSPLTGRASYEGMEIQILDDQHPKYQSRIKPAQYHGSIYDVVPAAHGYKKPTGEWNAEEIVADGRHIKVVLNGHTIVDANLDDVKDPEVLKRHPGLQRTTGHIGLLGHGTRVEFRNIRIKTLAGN